MYCSLILLDSFHILGMSHMHVMRTLPKSYEYFTKTLGGVDMDSYNIVGDGTPQVCSFIYCLCYSFY